MVTTSSGATRSARTALADARAFSGRGPLTSARVRLTVPRSRAALARAVALTEELTPEHPEGTLSFWEMYAVRALEEEGIRVDESSAETETDSDEELSRKEKEAEAAALRQLGDPIRMYFSQMARIPLLTREQEVELAKELEASRNRLRDLIYSTRYGQEQALAFDISEVEADITVCDGFDREEVESAV